MNKINRFLGTLLATLFATVICLNANAYSFMVDDLFYDINPDGISVTVTFENGPKLTLQPIYQAIYQWKVLLSSFLLR